MNGKTVFPFFAQKTARETVATEERLNVAAALLADDILRRYRTTIRGLASQAHVEANRARWGDNRIAQGRKKSLFMRLARAFISFFTDIVLPATDEQNFMTVAVISAMVLLSGILRFCQETRSDRAAEKLAGMVENTACVLRQNGGWQEIPMENIVAGDIVRLVAGDMVPADCRILQAKDLFISQSAMTGESEPVEKTAGQIVPEKGMAITGIANLAFMGTMSSAAQHWPLSS